MNALTDQQQAAVDALPREHSPCTYRVSIHLRRKGSHAVARTHTTWVRASSKRRARVVGFDTCNNLFSPMWRKRGLVAFSSYARVATPADLGCTEEKA